MSVKPLSLLLSILIISLSLRLLLEPPLVRDTT